VTREQASFDQGTVLRELCQQLPAGTDLSTPVLLQLTARIVQSPDVVPMLCPDGRAYTTLDMLAVEQHALALASRRDHDTTAQLPAGQVTPTGVRSGLRSDQQRAVLHLLTRGRGVELVTGPAGSGKTAALRIATETWQAQGIPVTGTAVAALSAQGLQDATGAPSVSLARLLQRPEQHLPTGGVLLVDEAAIIGTRSLTQLLELTEQQHCKLVLVGDPAQLPELEAVGCSPPSPNDPTPCTSKVITGNARAGNAWPSPPCGAARPVGLWTATTNTGGCTPLTRATVCTSNSSRTTPAPAQNTMIRGRCSPWPPDAATSASSTSRSAHDSCSKERWATEHS